MGSLSVDRPPWIAIKAICNRKFACDFSRWSSHAGTIPARFQKPKKKKRCPTWKCHYRLVRTAVPISEANQGTFTKPLPSLAPFFLFARRSLCPCLAPQNEGLPVHKWRRLAYQRFDVASSFFFFLFNSNLTLFSKVNVIPLKPESQFSSSFICGLGKVADISPSVLIL